MSNAMWYVFCGGPYSLCAQSGIISRAPTRPPIIPPQNTYHIAWSNNTEPYVLGGVTGEYEGIRGTVLL